MPFLSRRHHFTYDRGSAVGRVEGLFFLDNALRRIARKQLGLYEGLLFLGVDTDNRVDFSIGALGWLKGLEAMRIWECPICSKIYWAGRIDQPTCSVRCNKIRGARIQRGTYTETRPHLLRNKNAQQKGKK